MRFGFIMACWMQFGACWRQDFVVSTFSTPSMPMFGAENGSNLVCATNTPLNTILNHGKNPNRGIPSTEPVHCRGITTLLFHCDDSKDT